MGGITGVVGGFQECRLFSSYEVLGQRYNAWRVRGT